MLTPPAMFALFLTSAYLPFAFSFVLMIGIGLIEAIGLGLGHLNLDTDVDADGGFLAWLGLDGEVPFLIWLTSLLACFTIVGIALQQGATALAGAPFSWGLACGFALVAGAMLNTLAVNALVRVIPGFETTVISTDDLLRTRGTILEGTARRGSPARAKVIDRYGQAHYVMVEPHDEAVAIASGETVLLVRREGKLFYALSDTNALLQSI
jgi:hypothetical protein